MRKIVRWRKGKCVPLSQIVSILSVEEKKLMKEQCGGVQTFLKNQHQIFKVSRLTGYSINCFDPIRSYRVQYVFVIGERRLDQFQRVN